MGAVGGCQNRLADEVGERRILTPDRGQHLAQKFQFFIRHRLAALEASLKLVVSLGERRVVLKGADAAREAKQVIDLDRIELHRGRGGEPQRSGPGAQGLLDDAVEVAVLGRSRGAGGGIAAPGVMGLVDQDDIPVPTGQFSLPLATANQTGRDDDLFGLEHRLGRTLLFKRMQIQMASRRAGEGASKAQQELGGQLGVPLAGQARGRGNQDPPRQTRQDQGTQCETGLDGLAQAHFIAEQEAVGVGQNQAAGDDGLMWPGFDRSGHEADQPPVRHPGRLAQDGELEPFVRARLGGRDRDIAGAVDLARRRDRLADGDQPFAHRLR